MSNCRTESIFKNAALAAALAAVGIFGASTASAGPSPDFSNPAVAATSEAVIASGTCIARYTELLDDAFSAPVQIARRVARHCAKEISFSAGMASLMTGKPQEFAKNLKYAQEDLTTNAVVRYRAAVKAQNTGSLARN